MSFLLMSSFILKVGLRVADLELNLAGSATTRRCETGERGRGGAGGGG